MAFQGSKKYWILTLVLGLGLLALFVFKTNVPEKPGIKLEPALWVLGDVVLGKKYETEIHIRNNSLFPLEIVKTRPSCECITAEIKKPMSFHHKLGMIHIYSCGSFGGNWYTKVSTHGNWVLYKGLMSGRKSKNRLSGTGPSGIVRGEAVKRTVEGWIYASPEEFRELAEENPKK